MITSFKKDKLNVKIYHSRSGMGTAAAADAANVLRELLQQQPEVNMIFAAAPSQNEFLDALCASAGIDWTRVNAFHMDEYTSLAENAPQRFGNFLKLHIFSRVPFRTVNYLNADHLQPDAECERYAALLQRYPVDIVCMGIGENGHVAFNDPHVAQFSDPARVKIVDLDEKCRMQQVNDGCFGTFGEVPTHAFTLTVPALMSARYLFCMVPSKTKAWAVFHTLHDSISEAVPATCLRTHGNAVMYADTDSAELLPEVQQHEK